MTVPSDFLNPRSHYHGSFTPENLMFNANLQEFAFQISHICSLETNGKISPELACEEIGKLWEQLQQSKKQLGIGRFYS